MDPNANLREQEAIIVARGKGSRANAGRLTELRNALAAWRHAGGFAPDWDACPNAAKHWRFWRKATPTATRIYALVSDQGTAMSETALTEAEYHDPTIRAATEKNAPADAKRPLKWQDVSENDAINDGLRIGIEDQRRTR